MIILNNFTKHIYKIKIVKQPTQTASQNQPHKTVNRQLSNKAKSHA